MASGVLTSLPTPATTLSSGAETDAEELKGSGGSTPNLVTGASQDVNETISLPAVVLSSTAGAASSSGGSGDEGGDVVGGGGGKRETKRKLFDALEEFAPKRRSSRVGEILS